MARGQSKSMAVRFGEKCYLEWSEIFGRPWLTHSPTPAAELHRAHTRSPCTRKSTLPSKNPPKKEKTKDTTQPCHMTGRRNPLKPSEDFLATGPASTTPCSNPLGRY